VVEFEHVMRNQRDEVVATARRSALVLEANAAS